MGFDKLLVDYNAVDIREISPEAFLASDYDDFVNDKKIKEIFRNPALLKVICLQCDLFSLGKIKVMQNGKEVENDPVLNRFDNPNPMQTKEQWLWDYMFWNMLGNDYLYVDSVIATNENNKMYFLQANKIQWPKDFYKNSDKLVFSNSATNTLLNTNIEYRYNDGTAIQIPLSKIIIITDLTNGQGNWFRGKNRIDALYKVIANSEASLDAKNINTRYTGKFMVSGKQDPNNVTQLPLGADEALDIEQKINGRKQVVANKSQIDIKRFVENLGNLQLDEAYLADYFIIGNMYNIPRDVLEAALEGSTYENQEKATMRHISYTLQPKGNELMLALANKFGYTQQGKSIIMDWSYLPFMQVFEKDKSETEKNKVISFANMLNAGVSLDEINEFLDTKFTTGERNYVASTQVIKPGTGEQPQDSQNDL